MRLRAQQTSPATDSQAVVSIVDAAMAARSELGAMAGPVQAIAVAAAEAAKERTSHRGDDPSSNILMPDGTRLSDWFARVQSFMAGQSASAPVLTTAPTLSVGPQGAIQSGGYESASTLTTHTITFTSTIVAGHTPWVGFMLIGASVSSVIDNTGTAWTQAGAGTGTTNPLKVYYRPGVPTGVTSVTITASVAAFCTAIWQERDDIQTTGSVDVLVGAAYASGTTFTSGATGATTGSGIAVGVAYHLNGSAVQLTPSAPWGVFSGTGLETGGNVYNGSEGHTLVAASRTTANGTTPEFSGTMLSAVAGYAYIVVFKQQTSGPVSVGNDVTITPGTVTNGSGGDHTNEFTVIGVDAFGVETQVLTLTAASAATKAFKVGATLYGKRIKVSQTPIDTVNLLRGNSLASTVTDVVSGTLPSNSVAPSISPSGSQASGTNLTISAGTWTGAAEYGFQLTVDGVPIGARVFQSGTTLVVPTNDTYVGKSVSANVIGRSSDGLDSAPVNTSNSVTITGSAPPEAITYTSPPTWPANLYLDQEADFTDGTVTGTTVDGPGWDFYMNGTNPENLLPRPVLYPSLNAHNSISKFTPQSSLGVVVGATIYALEKRRGTDGVIYSTFSAGKVVSTPLAALTLTLSSGASAGFVFTAGSTVSSQVVGTITGGTTPYAVNQPLGSIGLTLSIQGSNVVVSGTPSVSVATPYTVTVTDAGASSPASQSVTITVNASGVVPASALAYSAAAVAISGANTAYDGINAKIYNGQVVLGPNGDGRDRHRLINGAPLISGGVRNELLWFNERYIEGQPIWLGFDLLFDLPGEFPVGVFNVYDYFLLMQTHTPLNGFTQPDIACFVNRQAGPGVPATINWRIAGTANAPSGGSTANDAQPAYFGDQDLLQGVRYRFILRLVPGWLASHGPRIDIWVRNGSATSWTQLVNNYTNFPNTYNNGGDPNNRSYVRIGNYKWTTSIWNNSPISMVMSPLFLARGDSQFTQMAAALDQLSA